MKKELITIIAATLIFSGACNRKKEEKEQVSIVKTCIVAEYGKTKFVSFPGKVKASSEVNLAFRISGPIAKIAVNEGDFVKKGQTLAEIDSRDYANQFAATEAEYKQVKAEAERIIQLYEKRSVSANDYDKAVSGLQQITAKYTAHKNALFDTKLCAPFDGYVQKRYFDKNETISAGMPVFSMIASDMPEVEINIPASEFIRRSSFASFSCNFDLFPEQTFPLELISINQKANLNQLYTMRLKMLANENTQTPTAGMSTMVSIFLKTEESNLLTIPINAMFEYNGKTCVWVYNESEEIVNRRHITLSEILTDGTLLVSQGLKVGEKVVAAGVHYLSEGERVKLLPQASKTNVGGLL